MSIACYANEDAQASFTIVFSIRLTPWKLGSTGQKPGFQGRNRVDPTFRCVSEFVQDSLSCLDETESQQASEAAIAQSQPSGFAKLLRGVREALGVQRG